MNDHATLIATGIVGAFFFIAGLLNILDNMLIQILLIAGFIAIIVNIILVKSQDEDEQKNLPD